MNSFFIRSVTLINPGSLFNGQEVDVIMKDGSFSEIGTGLEVPDNFELIEGAGKYLAPGFFDLNVTFGEPGQETREDLETGAAAAAAGGFTGVALLPNTVPPLHSKAEVAYIVNKSSSLPVNIYPVGTISHFREGKDLAELYDMHLSGAIAFSDGDRPVADSGLMSRAMLYVKSFNGMVFSYAEDGSLAGKGKMNEGETSTYLGMKGIPALAEEIMVARDLALAEYNDSRIHFSTISTANAIDLVRKARQKNIRVTCDVAAHHLLLTEEEVAGFDSNYKVKPPLRTKNDVQALLAGVKDGTIDAIVSQHTPHEKEFKEIEFEIAAYGITGLQTVLPMLIRAGLSAEIIVDKLAVGPRNILKLEVPKFETGAKIDAVLFDTGIQWSFDEYSNRSRSANSPFFGSMLTGSALRVFNGERSFSTF